MNVMKIQFSLLPNDIFDYLHDFLYDREYYNLLKTSRYLYSEKRQQIKYTLTTYTSERFYTNETFRQQILQSMKDPSKQLTLFLRGHIIRSRENPTLIEFPEKLRNIYHLVLICGEGITNIEGLQQIQILEIKSFPQIISLPDSLDGLQELVLISCPLIDNIYPIREIPNLHIENCPKLYDISMLGKQKKLILQRCENISQVHHLGKVKDLTIASCPKVVSVKGLGNVPQLLLMDCPIEDLHELQNNQSIKLLLFHQLRDYSSFQHIQELHFFLCNISNVSIFQTTSRVQKIVFQQCNELEDVTPLAHLQVIIFKDCHKLKYIHKLGNVPKLELDHCPEITTLQGLGNNRKITINSNHQIEDFHVLQNVYEVNIADCQRFKGIMNAQNHILRISNCPFLNDLHMFRNVHHLSIRNCSAVSHVEGLKDVFSVEIKNCSGLVSIEGFGNNHRVELFGCDAITKIAMDELEKIPELIIKECRNIVNSVATLP